MIAILSFLVAFVPLQGTILLNEIMYNPDGQTLGLDEHMEWIELYNSSTEAVNLAGMMITDGNKQIYLGHYLMPAGAYGVVCANEDSFKIAYGSEVRVLPWSGEWTRLRNSGDDVILYAENGTVVESVKYDEDWGANGTESSRADGGGSSLERIDPSALNDATNWRPSTDFANPSEADEDTACWGTPGAENSVCL